MPVINTWVNKKCYSILENSAKILHEKGMIKQPTLYAVSKFLLEDYVKRISNVENLKNGDIDG